MSDVLLQVENLTVEFSVGNWWRQRKKFRALNEVSFAIQRGDIFGVIGRNGCGKTTLLRVLTGAAQPTSGRVKEFAERPLSKALLSIGFGFDRYLTGRDNAQLSAMLQGLSLRRAKACLDDIQTFSELGDFFDQPVLTYSSGMHSKLGFATAMMLDVDVMLVDETLSVGDESFRKKAQDAMMDKMKRSQAVVFVSHNAEVVKSLCNKAIWMERGEVRASGSTERVAHEYHKFMAQVDEESRRH